MNDVNKHIKITKDLLIKAKAGDQQAATQIIDILKPFIQSEVERFYKNPDDDNYKELYQVGQVEAFKTIGRFNIDEHEPNKEYFKKWISGAIKRHHKKYLSKKSSHGQELPQKQYTEDVSINKLYENEIEIILQGSLLKKDEKYVYINYTGFNDTPVKSQKEIASDLGLHYVKISRLYTSAISKISTKLGISVNLFSKERRRSIWKKQKIGYSPQSIDDKLKLIEEISIMLNDMFPFHMAMIKIEKKLSDGSFRINVYQGWPVDMIKEKDNSYKAIIDTVTPLNELNAMVQFLENFINPNAEHDESIIIDKIPSRTILKEFVRLYAPHTTKEKMVNLLKKLRVKSKTIRGYVNSDPTVSFNRDKTELFLTIFDNYLMRNRRNNIKFKDIEKNIRVISVEDLLKMDDQGKIKLPYMVDKKRKLFCRIM